MFNAMPEKGIGVLRVRDSIYQKDQEPVLREVNGTVRDLTE